jgi:hypothetical protein
VASPRHRKSVPGFVRARRIGLPVAAVFMLVPSLAGAVAPSGDRENGSTGPGAVSDALSAAPSYPEAASRADLADVSRAGTRGPVSRGPGVPRPGDRAHRADRADRADDDERAEPAKRPDVEPVTRWLTADLNLWSGPGEDNRLITVLPERSKVRATRLVKGAWAQVLRADEYGWVRAAYLVAQRPPKEEPATTEQTAASGGGGGDSDGDGGSISGAPCPDGSAVESGLVSNAVVVYRAVCASFPAVGSWGGLRPGDDGDHGTGHALDIMVGADSSLGEAIASYVQENHSQLGVSEIIWAQHIWTVERSSEGWRPMEDRGSATANHYDHVHVSVY